MHRGHKKIISYFLCMLFGALFGAYWMAKKCEQELINKEERARRSLTNMRSACKLFRATQRNRCIENYFENMNINSVAIYGMGEIGTLLVEYLEQKGIEIRCIVDKNKDVKTYGYQLFSPDDDLPQTDAVIVTSAYYFVDIADKLRKHTDANIISIDDIR